MSQDHDIQALFERGEAPECSLVSLNSVLLEKQKRKEKKTDQTNNE